MPAQSLISILTTILGFALLSGLVLLVYRLVSRERSLARAEKKTLSHYQEIIDKANKQAAEMLEKAVKTSEGLISQTELTNGTVAADLDKIFREMAEKHIKSMGNEVVTFKKEYEDKIMEMQQAVDQNTKFVIQNTQYNLNKNLEAFTKAMMDKTSTSSEALEAKTKELLAKAEAEVTAYKEAEVAKVDKAISVLVQKTYQSLLGENIPPEINKDLILKALEKSKKEGLFDF